MARLIYSFIASLDGCIEDTGGRFDWAAPNEERRFESGMVYLRYAIPGTSGAQ